MENKKSAVLKSAPLFFGLLLISLTSIILALVNNQVFINYLNGDSLYDIETASNFWRNKSFAFQNFPIAACFFPDLLIYIVLEIFTHNITVLHLSYLFIFLLAELTIIFNLFRCSELDKKNAFWALCFSLGAFFLIIPYGISLNEWKGSHFSVLLYSLIVFQYYLTHSNQSISIKVGLIGFALTFLVYISDNIVVMYLMAPLGLVILIDIWLKQTSKKVGGILIGLFLLTILSGLKIPDLIEAWTTASFSNNGSLFRVPNHELLGQRFLHFPFLLWQHIKAWPVFYLMIFNYHLLTLVGLYFINSTDKSVKQLNRIILFLYLSQFINIVLTIMAGKLEVIAHFRYLTPIFFYPTLTVSLVVGHFLKSKVNLKFLIGFFLLIWISIFIHNYHRLFKAITLKPPYTSDAACIDQLHQQYSVKNGLAEYWHVRPIRMLSKEGVHLTQVNAELKKFTLIDNEIHAYRNIKNKIPLDYQFIIVDWLSREIILKNVGQPDRVVQCPHAEVWLYANQESSHRLNHYLSMAWKD